MTAIEPRLRSVRMVSGVGAVTRTRSRQTDQAFAEWYETSYKRVEATLILAAGGRDVGREAASEAFAKALERWPRVSGMTNRDGWVYRVGLNEIRRQARRRFREQTLAQTALKDPTTRPPLSHVDADLWAAVERLPEQQRRAIALKYVADLTERQVADAMHLSLGTVARHLHAARRSLATTIDQPPER